MMARAQIEKADEETLRPWLAQEECDVCYGTKVMCGIVPRNEDEDCPACQGTGLRVPGLTRECECLRGSQLCEDCGLVYVNDFRITTNSWHHPECRRCQGTNRIPIPDAELIGAVEEILMQSYAVSWSHCAEDGDAAHEYLVYPTVKDNPIETVSSSRRLAALRALALVVT